MIVALGISIAFLVFVSIVLGNQLFSLTKHEIATHKIARKVRFLLISDIHSKKVQGPLENIVKKNTPDCIVIAGDLWDRKKARVKECVKMVSALSKYAKVVYTPGNHDYSYPQREQMFNALRKEGISVLRADTREICGIQLVGIDYLSYRIFMKNVLKQYTDRYRVLLTHFPQYFCSEYIKYGVDLVLCGHAHGGQFRMPFTHRGLYSPGQGLFPKYTEGMHECNETKMLVSRGIGNSNRFPFRLFNPPEAVIIDLVPKSEVIS